jgi:hypothetical protein
MARDDRDLRFEKALARNLRANAPAEADATSHGCPDAEILAAYHERSLAPEQMISSKEHIAGCSRCQEVLAQLEATDELPVNAGQEQDQAENVLTMKVPDLALQEHAVAGAPMSAPRAASVMASPQKPRRAAKWQWFVPAGALAAGLLVWVSMHQTTMHQTNPPPLQVAKNEEFKTALPPAAQSEPAPSAKKESLSKDLQSSRPNLSDSRRDTSREAYALRQNSRAALDQETAPPAPTNKLIAPRGDLSPKKSAPAFGRAANPPSAATRTGVFAGKEFEKQGAAAAPAAPAPAKTDSAAYAPNLEAPAPAPPPSAALKARAVAGAAGPQPPQEERSAVSAMTESVEVSAATVATTEADVLMNSVAIAAPNGKVLWRTASAGIIQRSTDAGSTWTPQKSNVVADLLAGSAASDKVCWMVGRTGTIVRTTDGGKHWRKVRPPVEDDLDSVSAVGAQQATVSAASSHKSYATVDGGRTWSALPNP